jgi:surface carbohydrate biosynthesis protein
MRITIPVEIFVREFNSKLYLSLKLAEAGHDVYLGKSTSINSSFDIIDPDIHISNLSYVERLLADKVRAKIALLDSEGAFYTSESHYSDRISAERLDGVDYYFAWGNNTAKIARGNSAETEIYTTGNPRFDLLQPPLREIYQKESKSMRETYGDYILVNTNFAIPNHQTCSNPPSNVLNYSEESYSADKDIFTEFLDMITSLRSSLPEQNIVVRPHPGENHSTYTKRFEDYNNVHVKHEGNVRKWICGSQMVIHNNCTTGVESVLLNKPVVAYTPGRHNAETILNRISKQASTTSDLLAEVQDIFDQESKDYFIEENNKNELKDYIYNINNSSVEQMITIIDRIEPSSENTSYQPGLKERSKRRLNTIIGDKGMTQLRKTGLIESWQESDQKFSYVSNSHVKGYISLLSNIDDIFDVDFTRSKQLENTFHIYSTT